MKALIAALTLVTLIPHFTQVTSAAAPNDLNFGFKIIGTDQWAESGRRMSQYCAPEDNQAAPTFYCRNWQLIPMGS
jgi:hypothetical protein